MKASVCALRKRRARPHLFFILLVAIVFLFSTAGAGGNQSLASDAIQPKLTVDEVWAGAHVRFDAISVGSIVYVAYYDADRRFAVARVDTATGTLSKRTLDSVFGGWDTHNYVTLAFDNFGYLHVAGNMHASPLVYARMLKPGEFQSLTSFTSMVGLDEFTMTYPKFFTFPNGDLAFTYRAGTSGDGVELINRFNGHSWSRYSKTPVFSSREGGPKVNAYHTGYIFGSDGYYHVAWVWRLNPMVETNFDVNYARSQDLEHWLDHRGREMASPLAPGNADVAEKIAPGSGLYNNVKLGFDGFNVPIVSYLKYDELGYTQLYHARPTDTGWQVGKITDWHFRWEFKGKGSQVMKISFSGVKTHEGIVTESVQHPDTGPIVISYSKDGMTSERLTSQPVSQKRKCSYSKPWVEGSQEVRKISFNAYQGRIMWRTLPSGNNDRPRSCNSIGLAEGCRMVSKLVLVPVEAESVGLACAP